MAEHVVLAHPAAAMIAVIAVIGGDGAADHGGADEACSDTPAPAMMIAMGFGGCGGGGDAGCDSERGKGDGGELGLDGHDEGSSWVWRPVWSACPVGRGFRKTGSNRSRLAWRPAGLSLRSSNLR